MQPLFSGIKSIKLLVSLAPSYTKAQHNNWSTFWSLFFYDFGPAGIAARQVSVQGWISVQRWISVCTDLIITLTGFTFAKNPQFNEPVTPFNSLLEYLCLVNIPMDKVINLWQAILKIFHRLKIPSCWKDASRTQHKLLLLVEILCFQINFEKVQRFKLKFLEDELL